MDNQCTETTANLPNGALVWVFNAGVTFLPNINWSKELKCWVPSPIPADKHLEYSDYHIELMNPKDQK